jgi:lipopolysaccharide/colanic/teichoic acid biosynthesis glycosyltransferase
MREEEMNAVSSGNARIEERHREDSVSFYDVTKRCVDLAGASFLLVALSPVMASVALGVKMTSPGPILYGQTRLTQGGEVFRLLKFRSMRVDAEADSGAVLATRADPRVTSIGSFLRKTRLDELPQLLNVLKGEMSLIGPRPERPEIASQLAESIPKVHRRLQTRAGLTGLAQVIQGYPDGRKGYRRKVGLDLIYIRKKSILLDMWIALRTVSVVLTGSGAR